MEYIKFTVSADISTDEYIRDYVNIEEFLDMTCFTSREQL